jgi:hypothetical protein
MDPVEWLARLGDHIPDPGQHRTLFYGEYLPGDFAPKYDMSEPSGFRVFMAACAFEASIPAPSSLTGRFRPPRLHQSQEQCP